MEANLLENSTKISTDRFQISNTSLNFNSKAIVAKEGLSKTHTTKKILTNTSIRINSLTIDRSKIKRMLAREANMLKSRDFKTRSKENNFKRKLLSRSNTSLKQRKQVKINNRHHKSSLSSKISQLFRSLKEEMSNQIISKLLLMRKLIRIKLCQQDRFNRSKRNLRLWYSNKIRNSLNNLNSNQKLKFKMIASIQAKPPEMHKTRCHIDKYSLKRSIITRMIRKEVDQMSLRGLL